MAPRPLLALIEDYWPRFNRAAEHVRAGYQQLGVPEKFPTEEATDPHSWTAKLRLASTDWLSRWAYGRSGPSREPDFEAENPETRYCTPNGSLRYSQRGDTIFSLISKKQQQLPPAPAKPAGLDEIRKTLRYTRADVALAPRNIVTTQRKGYKVEKVEFLSEPGIYIPAWEFVPDSAATPRRARVYRNRCGKRAEHTDYD